MSESGAPLQIRSPDRGFIQLANDCIARGCFDSAIRKIKDCLHEAAAENDKAKAAFYTRAFLAFLHAKGGSYAFRPTALTAAAFEPPTF